MIRRQMYFYFDVDDGDGDDDVVGVAAVANGPMWISVELN